MPQSRTVPTEDPTQASNSPKPVDKFRDGPVHVSIWQNEGPNGAFRKAKIELRYRNKDEEWQTGHSYSSSELLHLESAAREAHTRIEKWQQAVGRKSGPRPQS